jgi:hypothetical protein
VAVAAEDYGSPDDEFPRQPSGPSGFVCGLDVLEGRSFARLSTPDRTHFLGSAPPAQMFFEAEEAPAHDHRARHDFDRSREAIVEAVQGITETINP